MPKRIHNSISHDIRAIRNALATIMGALDRLAPLLDGARAAGAAPARRVRRLKLSPARQAALKLQGQYMGHIRTLPPRLKARVKAMRARKGIRPAIRLARSLAGR